METTEKRARKKATKYLLDIIDEQNISNEGQLTLTSDRTIFEVGGVKTDEYAVVGSLSVCHEWIIKHQSV